MLRVTKYSIIAVIYILLTSCSLTIDNHLPGAKVVIEKEPDKDKFYSATYRSVGQSIYNKNVEIFALKDGSNKIPLEDDVPEYAIYFVIPHTSDDAKYSSWKYIINTDESNKFLVSSNGKIIKT